MWPDDAPRKRTLGIKDKEHLWKREGKRCSNPACGRKLDFTEMQVGHKKAYSRGGSTAFSNLVSLCYPCNKLQGTDSWAVFLRKQGVTGAKTTATQAVKTKLQALTVTQLKAQLVDLQEHFSEKKDEGVEKVLEVKNALEETQQALQDLQQAVEDLQSSGKKVKEALGGE